MFRNLRMSPRFHIKGSDTFDEQPAWERPHMPRLLLQQFANALVPCYTCVLRHWSPLRELRFCLYVSHGHMGASIRPTHRCIRQLTKLKGGRKHSFFAKLSGHRQGVPHCMVLRQEPQVEAAHESPVPDPQVSGLLFFHHRKYVCPDCMGARFDIAREHRGNTPRGVETPCIARVETVRTLGSTSTPVCFGQQRCDQIEECHTHIITRDGLPAHDAWMGTIPTP